MSALLPPSSLVGVETRRLARAEILWRGSGEAMAGIDPDRLFCCPQKYEADNLYGTESRVEWADRYGGYGIGAAGGSGRCSTLGGLQTKGVGVTPLVSPQADDLHASGMLMLCEAATEALFSAVYQICLPFGAVPVLAVIVTGGSYSRTFGDAAEARCLRSLMIRPFVARPAHFLRNLLNPDGLLPAGADNPGMTVDTLRTMQSMECLATNLKSSLGLLSIENDEAALLHMGFRELARRLAWQCAAGFAKRLPHGTWSCSNMTLSGAYLDFGISNFVPSYRRLCWAEGQDPWTESQWPLRSLRLLRQQLDKYHPSMRGQAIINCDDLTEEYERHFNQRLAIEMAKMAGLTEDMAVACPAELLQAWLTVMRRIWTRGAEERFVTRPGHFADGRSAPPPRQTGRFDLNAILAAAGPCANAECMERALAPLLNDPTLRRDFVHAAGRVRAWLRVWAKGTANGLDAYLGRQALRKNAALPVLQREKTSGLDLLKRFRQLEIDGETAAIGPAIDQALNQARHVLTDLDPALPGSNGMAQMEAISAHVIPTADDLIETSP